jgi:uncharacterized protein YlaI
MKQVLEGYISKQYTVWCGICGEWEYVDGNNLTQAGKNARKKEWKYTPVHGWVCQQCKGASK